MKLLLFISSIAESTTGLLLVLQPSNVVGLLLGSEPSGVGLSITRVAGLSLMGFGIACWATRSLRPPGAMSGILLWPAIAIHFGPSVSLGWLIGGRTTA